MYQRANDALMALEASALRSRPAPQTDGRAWTTALPRLQAGAWTLRELEARDAAALLEDMVPEEVQRFISEPPDSIEGFERFIAWTHRQREQVVGLVYGIVPDGSDRVIGIFQLQALSTGWSRAEWGCALARGHWGTGVFMASAVAALDFGFDRLGIERLEARVAAENSRAISAIRKLGARYECVLRQALNRRGVWLDQLLCTVTHADWRSRDSVRRFLHPVH